MTPSVESFPGVGERFTGGIDALDAVGQHRNGATFQHAPVGVHGDDRAAAHEEIDLGLGA